MLFSTYWKFKEKAEQFFDRSKVFALLYIFISKAMSKYANILYLHNILN